MRLKIQGWNSSFRALLRWSLDTGHAGLSFWALDTQPPSLSKRPEATLPTLCLSWQCEIVGVLFVFSVTGLPPMYGM